MLKISENLKRHLQDEVPIPEPEQFGKGEMRSHDGSKCCLVGWARVAVGGAPYVFTSLQYSAAEELASLVAKSQNPVDWNDNKRRSPADVAKRWRDTMKKLGYRIVRAKR